MDKKYTDFYLNGQVYKTQLTKKVMNAKPWDKDLHKKVTAFIPGTVKELFVKKGQEVKKGDVLLILEAMKMKNKVRASMDGKIKNIYVRESQIVAKNFVLVDIE